MLKLSKKQLEKICQEYGYDIEVVPNILKFVSALQKSISDNLLKDINK